MAQRGINARLRFAANTDLQWQALNPILLAGERVIVTDLHRTKTGNGSAAYNTLPFDDADIYTAIAAAMANAEATAEEVAVRAPPLPSGAASGTHVLSAVRAQGVTTYLWLEYGETPINTILERIELLEKMVFTHEVTSNPYMVIFDNLTGVVAFGVWRQELQCLEC
jgi:hypothetical protein